MAEETPSEPTWDETVNEKVDQITAALEDLVGYLSTPRISREIRRRAAGLEYVVSELRGISSTCERLAKQCGGDA